VHALRTYDYAIVRVVPRVERGEFINAGIILSCDVERTLEACVELDENALLALDAHADLALIKETLATIPAICAGGAGAGSIGRLSARERFHWLVAPRSAMVQTSPVHTGRCADPLAALQHLMNTVIRRNPGSTHGAYETP
jgi:Protein of unknown function (DUF3037)